MNIHSKVIRRITITSPMSESKKAIDYVYRNGYRTVMAGPMPIARYRYDTTRYRIIAEKRIG